MKNLILTLIITLPLTLWGQGWEQTYGGENEDRGFSVKQTFDGGYIVTGNTNSYGKGSYDVLLVKVDENGNLDWLKTFGGTGEDVGVSIQQTKDGGFIVTGRTGSFGDGGSDNVYLIKIDENGNEQWSQTFGGDDDDSGISIQQTTDGGYIITGETWSFGNGGSDVYLIKTDENGNEQWSQTFGGDGDDIGISIQQTTDGGYIITGYTNSFGNGYHDVYLIKIDENGIEEWNKTFGGDDYDRGYSIQQTTDGGYIITGETQSYGIGSENSESNIWLIKTDNNGEIQWTNLFGEESSEIGYSVKQTTDNGFVIVGYNEDPEDIYFLKTDENGNEQWTQTFGGDGYEIGFCIEQTNDSGFIIVGYTENSFNDNNDDIYLIKTNQFGNITSTFEIPLPNPNRKIEKTINLQGQEVKPQTNTPIIEIFDDGSVEKKLIIEK